MVARKCHSPRERVSRGHASVEQLKGDLKAYMKQYLVSFEERDQVIRPMAENGQEAVVDG